ncbi:DUF4238 domain-containing protein [Bradyrhizobium sp.]|uniref:DUF4238 domain-containing protein n=1 Tax=Bradyrhizobium sp. TaxID=376 RepID=UPI001EBF71F3|nr:DUF4238 domain-containing protein [Bradyrhizobium sp.]MBV9983459.1 DUF4238 domain-containing protein [Bradyrhizobium sp.]
MTIARAHHFVPQCYLASFAQGGKINVFDFESGKDPFSTNTKNVAQERDFNRIDSDDLPPDALESAYANFEGELAPVLKRLVSGAPCSEDDFSYILTLMGVLAVRNPRYRANFADFQNNARLKILAVQLSTKERWERQLARMRKDGYLEGVLDVPYETLKAQLEEGAFKFVTTTGEHARTELYALDNLINILAARTWRWVRASNDSGGFITSDHPVCLNWIRRPRGFAPLGYGLSGTTVYFPLSPNLAVIGEFDGPMEDLSADVYMVANFNRRILNNAKRQAYMADYKFRIFDGATLFGIEELVRRSRERAREAG